jgi:hypothetical protein
MSISDNFDMKDAVRTAVSLLVDHEERRVGSREAAYSEVANRIHQSYSWVKKRTLGGEGIRQPRASLLLAVRHAYIDMCNRVEQEHKLEEAKLSRLKGEIDAVTEGLRRLAERENSSNNSRNRTQDFDLALSA